MVVLLAVVLGSISLAAQSGQVRPPAQIDGALKAAYEKYRTLKEGKNADYIPALAKVDSNLFGIALVTPDGKVYTAGDVKTEVSIQSISKVFTMAEVIQEEGLDAVARPRRRRCHGRTVQLDHRDRVARSRERCPGDEPAGESRRDRHDEHGAAATPPTRCGKRSSAFTRRRGRPGS